MSSYLTVFLVVYIASALYLASALLYGEYKISKAPEWRPACTYGELVARLFVAFFPVINTTIAVCFTADFIGKKLKKVLKKPVFKG